MTTCFFYVLIVNIWKKHLQILKRTNLEVFLGFFFIKSSINFNFQTLVQNLAHVIFLPINHANLKTCT
jgi:hypothetical protein